MTEKQKRFADEYIISLNATEAYKKAYPNIKKDNTASSSGHRLLRNDEIKAYIEKRLAEKETHLIAKQDEVLAYLTSVMRGESSAEVVVVEGEGDGCSKARKVSKAPDERERLRAAELLGKRYGLYIEKQEVDADLSLKIEVDYGDD